MTLPTYNIITQGTGGSSLETIPDRIDNLPVLSISDYAYKALSWYTETEGISNKINLKETGEYAFYKVYYLQSVYLGGCEKLAYDTFYLCSRLTTVSCPRCEVIEAGAFYGCSSLTTLSFPKLINVGDYTFNSTIWLSTLLSSSAFATLNNVAVWGKSASGSISNSSISYIANNCFSGAKSLTTVAFPNCITVNQMAFYACSNLTSVSLPRVSKVGYSAFTGTAWFNILVSESGLAMLNCTALYGSRNAIVNNYTNSEIVFTADWAFTGCTGLVSLNLPNCRYVGESTFSGCTSLTTVSLPKCNILELCAFKGCTTLTSVYLPTVNSIGINAFNSTAISSWSGINSSYFDSENSCLIEKSTSTMIDILHSGYSTNISASKVLKVRELTGMNYSSITSLNLPNAVMIGCSAFLSCKSLTTVSLPNCEFLDDYAFSGCNSLTTLSIPGCEYLYSAFSGCTSLTSVDLPNCKVISGAFLRCTSITSVSIPNCLVISGYGAFEYITASYIDLPKCSLISGNEAFYRASFVSFSAPNAIKVGSYAFINCDQLTTISLPKCEFIDELTFMYCDSLSSVYLPVVSCINGGCFSNISALTNLTLLSSCVVMLSYGEAVNSLPFSNCANLSNIYVRESLVKTYPTWNVWVRFSSAFKPAITKLSLTSLAITGENCLGVDTNTILHVTEYWTILKWEESTVTNNYEIKYDVTSDIHLKQILLLQVLLPEH